MRFHLGPPPSSPTELIALEGWQSIRFALRSEKQFFLSCHLAMVPMFLLLTWAWSNVDPRFGGLGIIWNFDQLLIAAGIVLVILPHELLHAVGHPGLGLRKESVLGFYWQQFSPYAHYMGTQSCLRLIMGALLPLMVLTLVPLAVALSGGPWHSYGALLSIINGVLAAGDVLVVASFAQAVPLRAEVRNFGLDNRWRAREH